MIQQVRQTTVIARRPAFQICVVAMVFVTALPATAALVKPYTSDANTAVLYHLNEPTGQNSSSASDYFVTDSSANGQNLRTNFSATPNAAFSPFDGVQSVNGLETSATSTSSQRLYRVSSDADVDIFNTQTFTIEAWIRSPGTSNFPGIFRVDSAANEIVQFGLDTNGDQLRLAYFNTGGVFNAHVSDTTFTFEADTWYHVAVTYSGDGLGGLDSEIKFFVDSEFDYGDSSRPGTQLGSTITNAADINPFEAGDNGDIWVGEFENNNFLNGDIDEVRWSNVVRSEFNLAFTPEPSAFALAALGLVSLCFHRRKRR